MPVKLTNVLALFLLDTKFRSPSTHKMSPWVKTVFLHFMPRLLMMRRPPYSPNDLYLENLSDASYVNDGDFR